MACALRRYGVTDSGLSQYLVIPSVTYSVFTISLNYPVDIYQLVAIVF
ncbi:MAG: hypothetical protein P8X74_10600 [Reinekea sp.]